MVRVALLLVSHSAKVAEGAAEMAAQMAPDVRVLAAGGVEGGIGTSLERVLAALEQLGAELGDGAGAAAADGGGVVVLTDLGSAVLTAEAALEMIEADRGDRIRIPAAPFVEGAVMAAVEAQQGGDLDAVVAAATGAGGLVGDAPTAPGTARAAPTTTGTTTPPAGGPVTAPAPAAPVELSGSPVEEPVGEPDVSAGVVLADPVGLHARPAALLARTVADLGAAVRVDGADARSVLELLQLGAVGGQRLTVTASGDGAREAVAAVVRLLGSGPGDGGQPA